MHLLDTIIDYLKGKTHYLPVHIVLLIFCIFCFDPIIYIVFYVYDIWLTLINIVSLLDDFTFYIKVISTQYNFT